jgi:hypothetical protein
LMRLLIDMNLTPRWVRFRLRPPMCLRDFDERFGFPSDSRSRHCHPRLDGQASRPGVAAPIDPHIRDTRPPPGVSMCIWLSGLFTQPRPQNPSHTYAGNRLTVRNPTRS